MKKSHQENNRENERGSVLFYILIAVVLFAALSYTVGGMMRGGDATMITEERSKLLAGEILDYARSIRQAIQHMKISNGCQDTDFRFINNITAGYGASVDTACDVFSPSGGDVNYIAPNNDYGAGTEWIFSGNIAVNDLGDAITEPELAMILPNINPNICQEINNNIGLSTTPNPLPGLSSLTMTKFTGAFLFQDHLGGALANHSTQHDGQRVFCFEETDTGDFFFIQVLLPR